MLGAHGERRRGVRACGSAQARNERGRRQRQQEI
uniref:Uncharacterized protein n=1 Tax=Anguilla anguilla TaxID=7936 RepID=A0A0E9R159_ANGAN